MSKRLLLADDSITIQKVIGITFANEDYQLDIVDNGTSALEHARAHRPDAVLADVYMPGRNGYELCAAIKQDPQLQGVPVLLLAGTFEPFDEDKAKQAGADGWIAKPFESQALIDRVEELIQDAAQLQPPAAFAAVAEVEAEEGFETPMAAEADEDLWAEPEALEAEEELDLAEDLEPLSAASEAAVAEDVWGSISFDEEDLVGDVAEEPIFVAEPARPAAPVVAPVAAPLVAEESWDEEADDIFDLEDEDIIDEADLIEDLDEPLEAPVAAGAPQDEVFGSVDEEPIELDREPLPAVEPVSRAASAPAWVDEYEVSGEAATEAVEAPGLEEPAVETVFETAEAVAEDLDLDLDLEAPEYEESGAEPSFEPTEVAETEAPLAEPAAQSAVATPAAVTLDEAEVEKIVARVAGEVIERLAGTLLEKIAWEVVPDLAEGMIKDEIRRIKATMQ